MHTSNRSLSPQILGFHPLSFGFYFFLNIRTFAAYAKGSKCRSLSHRVVKRFLNYCH